MDDGLRLCPVCSTTLLVDHLDGMTTWTCSAGHGVGLNILEAYGHLQRDELEAMWAGAKDAPLSKLLSPMTGMPMAEITFVVDNDTTLGNEGSQAEKLTIELDIDTYFAWFEPHELAAMPLQRNEGAPAGVGFVGVEDMGFGNHVYDQFSANGGYDADEDAQGRLTTFLGGLARKLGV